eukprot:272402_1
MASGAETEDDENLVTPELRKIPPARELKSKQKRMVLREIGSKINSAAARGFTEILIPTEEESRKMNSRLALRVVKTLMKRYGYAARFHPANGQGHGVNPDFVWQFGDQLRFGSAKPDGEFEKVDGIRISWDE